MHKESIPEWIEQAGRVDRSDRKHRLLFEALAAYEEIEMTNAEITNALLKE